MNLTDLERLALLNIIDNNFSTGSLEPVWSDSINDSPHADVPPRSLPGVISSLCKKDLASAWGEGSESVVALTERGAELARKVQAEQELTDARGEMFRASVRADI